MAHRNSDTPSAPLFEEDFSGFESFDDEEDDDEGDDLDAPDPVSQAIKARLSGDIDGAIAILQPVVGEDLANPRAFLTLGKLLAETDQLDRAQHYFRHALKLDPDSLDVRLAHATFLGEVGKLDEALTLFEALQTELLERRDEDPDTEGTLAVTQVNLARVLFDRGETEQAEALVGPLLTHPDVWEPAHGLIADIYDHPDADPVARVEQGLVSGAVSPLMVLFLLESLFDESPGDFVAADAIIARANAIFDFDFDWTTCDEELEAFLGGLRARFGAAVMRGQVDAARCPNLSALRSGGA